MKTDNKRNKKMKKQYLIVAISCLSLLSGGVFAVEDKDDGIDAAIDNCPEVYNPDQLDTDGDRIGDECEVDDTAKKTIVNVYDRYFGKGFTLESGAERMGYSFAQPVVTFIPGYGEDSNSDGKLDAYKPVVILSAGYDPTKDYIGEYEGSVLNQDGIVGVTGSTPKSDGTRKDDSLGNAIYFIDALSGTTIATLEGGSVRADGSSAPSSSSAAHKYIDGLNHGIAAAVTPVDADGNGVVERIYFPDIIGNIWRVDLELTDNDGVDVQNWRAYKFAELGADGFVGILGPDYATNDRRIFNQIDVVRTSFGGTVFDAVLVGSGNIANPEDIGLSSPVQDMFFMIKDTRITPYSTYTSSDYPINTSHLQDATSAVISVEEATSNKGWFIKLAAGEKVMSSSSTVDGSVFFTTIIPAEKTACTDPQSLPEGYLYGLKLHTASAIVNKGDTATIADRKSANRSDGGTMLFQQIDPYVNSTDGSVNMVDISGTQTAIGEHADEGKELKGGTSYWHTENQ